MYALVDCNCFYVSCERIFRPDLWSRPVVVLSNNDGCVISRSKEAKAVGVPMGAPAFKYRSLFQENKVAVFSSNFSLYGDISHRVMTTLKEASSRIEVYSIDEAFLELPGMDVSNYDDWGRGTKGKLMKDIGIPVCVGIGPSKTLSKVANHIAKKFKERTGGVYVIDTEEKRQKALRWLKLEDIWGIGRRLSRRLRAVGVKNAAGFVQLSDAWILRNLSVVELRLKKELLGIPVLSFET